MNKLINEKSPYLLQHAYNPVDWYAWNDEAFEKAKNKNKPIFLSIGYSTCHWCHVMEKESFEDERIAALLNETFICIKVDREERPDIDDVYMTVCQAMTGSGGWPLTIMMTPDKQPFFAATYIPPKNIYGRTGMLDLIANVQKIWQEKQGEVLQQAKEITDQLATALHKPATEMDLPHSILAAASAQLIGSYDKEFGGFGTAPKFPTPHHLLFLLRHAHFSKDEQALASVTHTLRAMRFGGIFDQIGKGFHRYSTDREWRVPHFEKMLYDQAFLSITYIEALQITQDTFFSKTAQEILDYVLRDLQSPDGGFYSAEDADSEGHEGTFYTWRYTEIIKLLGKETTDTLAQHYDLQAAGNFNEEATGQPTGQNIFIFQSNSEKHPGDLFAAECSQLFAEREKRVRPHLDDKILTDWNGMMIAALARAAHVFGEKKYSEAAEKAASFILTQMMQKDRLLHRYRDGEAAIEAFSADYAFMIYGLLELYTATFKTYYLEKAIALQKQQIKYFWDDKNNGFFTSAHDQEQLLFQQKDQYDNATPSTNSMSAANLIRLARLTAFSGFDHTAEKLIRSLAAHVKRAPTAFSYFLYAFYLTQQSKEVIIVGKQDAGDSKKMLDAIRAKYLPHASILFKTEKNHLEKLAPFTKEYDMQDERATAFVCTNYSCQTPTHDIQKMLADLK